MTFPGVPNFTVGTRGAGWWRYTDGAGNRLVCASQGLTIAQEAQRYVKDHLLSSTPVFGAHLANVTTLTVDGIVGPNTIKCAYALMLQMGVPASSMLQIESDFDANNQINAVGLDVSRPTGAQLSDQTMRMLIFFAGGYAISGDWSRIVIGSPMVSLKWGIAPANDGAANGLKTCWNPDTEQTPAEAGGTGTQQVPDGSGGGSGTTAITAPATTAATGFTTGEKIGMAALGLGTIGLGVAVAAASKKKQKHRRR